MFSKEIKSLDATKTYRLHNKVCPYCRCHLVSRDTTKEHVIGRRFVPKGKLNRQWNLILNACSLCNNRKAELEDDISAITLQPELDGKHPEYDEITIKDAQRKAQNSFSRRTKKLITDSKEALKFTLPFTPNAKFAFNFVSPPQIDPNRAYELARLQLAGFFFWITYQKEMERGYTWTGGFHPIKMVRRTDFGNDLMVSFAEMVLNWEPRLVGHTADGLFGVCIRRHSEEECWSWALEWNGSTRLIGFLGNRSIALSVAASLRQEKMHHQDLGGSDYIRFRTETPLNPEQDRLFLVQG